MGDPPTGTVTFLFTDIEGSTRLWDERPDEMRAALTEHDALVRAAIDAHGGYVFSTGGDGFAAAFSRAADAVDAAAKAQAELAGHPLINVRMGIHTGEAHERDGDYFGPAVNRAARLMAVGHGGQILVSQSSADLLSGSTTLFELGRHRLRDLSQHETVYQLGDGSFPPLRAVETYRSNLPVELTSFLGRHRELASVQVALDSSRLVTLTGVGGVGKTRLALQAAADSLDRYPDGVWVIELANVEDGALVGAEIAAALTLQPRAGSALTAVIDYLVSRELLLVIDNCEHVIDDAAQVVESVLRRCPSVRILATSREGLDIDGEQIIPVGSLPLPDASGDPADIAASDSVQLFVERAGAAGAELVVDPHTAPDVARVVLRLDGIPLALELAASRLRSMSLAELADGLDHRFSLLAARRRSFRRHQTLRAAIDWSHDLLEPIEQIAFRRLSVFTGGCTVDAARRVIADEKLSPSLVRDALARLVDKSLVVVVSHEAPTRYSMLETIREYAGERLHEAGEAERLDDAHAQYFVAFAQEAADGMRGPDAPVWARRIEDDVPDLQLAVEHLVTRNDADGALRLVSALGWYYQGHQYVPVGRWALMTARMSGVADDPRRPLALGLAGYSAYYSGDVALARALWGEAGVMHVAADLPYGDQLALHGQLLAMLDRDTEAVARCASSAVDWAVSNARTDEVLRVDAIGSMVCDFWDLPTDGDRLARLVPLAVEQGSPELISHVRLAAAQSLMKTEPERAIELAEASLEGFRQCRTLYVLAVAHQYLARLYLGVGDKRR